MIGAASGRRKTKLCAYYQQGRCNKGFMCTYAHGEHELEGALGDSLAAPQEHRAGDAWRQQYRTSAGDPHKSKAGVGSGTSATTAYRPPTGAGSQQWRPNWPVNSSGASDRGADESGAAASGRASSVNTALTNPVLALFGHAKAREIASDPELVRRTNTEGKRFLTQQSRETQRGAHLQFGWIKYRHTSLEEIRPILLRKRLSEANVAEVGALLGAMSLVHTVVTNIHDEGFIVTNYFANPQHADFKELVRSTLFDFLDNDDPTVISDAMSDPIFLSALQAEFESGDRRDPRLWKSLSKLKAPLNILYHCCGNDYAACVEALLASYSLQTAEQPWQVLAEPDLWVDKFRNTAFHSAAYAGSGESLQHLVSFARQHRVDVTSFVDKDGKTALDLAEARGNLRCYDILAPSFGVPLKGASFGDVERLDRSALMIVDYAVNEDASSESAAADTVSVSAADLLAHMDLDTQRLIAELSASDGEEAITVSSGKQLVRVEIADGGLLWDVYQPPQRLAERLSASGDAFVHARFASRLRRHVAPEGTAAELLTALRKLLQEMPSKVEPRSFRLLDYRILYASGEDEPLREIFSLLRSCGNVTLYKCLCEPPTLLHICRTVRELLEAKSTKWTQLYVFPSCIKASDEHLGGFRTELPKLVAALRESSVLHISRSGCKTCSIPAGPLPAEARCWAGALGSCLDVNRFVSMLKARRLKQASGVADRTDGIPAFFARGVLHIWRFGLDTARLFDSGAQSVETALDPGTETYVTEWLKNLSWAFRGADSAEGLDECRERLGLDAEELGEILQNMDFAVWALLRMHRLLPYAPQAVAQQLPAGVFERMEKARAYWLKKGWEYRPR